MKLLFFTFLLLFLTACGNHQTKNDCSCSTNGDVTICVGHCKEDDPYNKILAADVLEKIEDGDDFVLYIGYESCSGCQAFQPVLKRYAKDYPNQKIYYLSIETSEDGEYKDATLNADVLEEISQHIENILGEGLVTPTVAAFRDGECVDAKVGGGMNGISVSDLISLYNQAQGLE